MLSIATVLHPTDFSEDSEFAFRLACSLAREHNARLVLLHVLPPPMVIYGGGLAAEDARRDAEEARGRLRRMEAEAADVRAESQVMEGNPADGILRAAEEIRSDVIVMGTHGRTTLSRLLVGSVAEAVLRKAPCPVLTAKPVPEWEKVVEEGEAQAEAGAGRAEAGVQ